MVFVTGDIHGHHDIGKLGSKSFHEGRDLTKSDYVICTGDFGLIWDVNESGPQEKYWLDWLTDKKWTTLFLDGNHENFDRLFALPEKIMLGGKVGIVNDSIFHLKRGEIYWFDNHKVFVFGGAQSIDKIFRTPFISWWPQEIPSYTEMQYGLENLEKVENEVDYILTHTGPRKIVDQVPYKMTEKMNDPTLDYLTKIDDTIKFKKWYFSHMHEDMIIEDKYICQYQKIERML